MYTHTYICLCIFTLICWENKMKCPTELNLTSKQIANISENQNYFVNKQNLSTPSQKQQKLTENLQRKCVHAKTKNNNNNVPQKSPKHFVKIFVEIQLNLLIHFAASKQTVFFYLHNSCLSGSFVRVCVVAICIRSRILAKQIHTHVTK